MIRGKAISESLKSECHNTERKILSSQMGSNKDCNPRHQRYSIKLLLTLTSHFRVGQIYPLLTLSLSISTLWKSRTFRWVRLKIGGFKEHCNFRHERGNRN